MIYLDHNATTPVLPEVLDAMLPFLATHFGNPSSGHGFGAAPRAAVTRAREQVAGLLGCEPDEVIFTSGGTEANNLAIRGVAEASARRGLVTSAIEHPATWEPCDWLAERGWRVTRLLAGADGRVRVAEAAEAIGSDTALVTVMHANNETGVLQPIRELAELARASGALTHTDAAQSAGKVPVRVRELGVDLLSLAGHKLYAPKGVGALFVRRGVRLTPVLRGAGQETGLRPGTENVPGIVGLGAACELAARDLESEAKRVRELRDSLWDALRARVPGLTLNGHVELRLPNTLNVRFPGVSGAAVLRGAPDVAASTGAACHGERETPSESILALGVSRDEALGSARLTLGRATTKAEIELAAKALAQSWLALTRKE